MTSALLVENGTVITPSESIPDGAILVHGSSITAVGQRRDLAQPASVERVDAGGGYVVPGFVNMHVHGVGGYDALDASVDSLAAMSRMMTLQGVTSWVPTMGSATPPELAAALAAIREARVAQAASPDGAEILGGHIEGRYLSPHERGAHRLDLLTAPDPAEYGQILSYADAICVWTLAPELPGALELIAACRERGIVVAAGHSIAIDEELSRAVDAGLSHAVHFFGNMGTLRRVNIRRVAGLVESVLLDDRITIEMITDGHHIAPSLMRLALKVKGPERVAIITDGSHFTGYPTGRYQSQGLDIIVEPEITYLADRSAYAGSVATMDRCLRVAIPSMDLTLAGALRMASLTPARILGVARRKGSLAPGKDADITILDGDLHVLRTIVRGHVQDMAPVPLNAHPA